MSLSHPTTTVNDSSLSGWVTLHRFGDTFRRDSWSLTPQGMYAHLGKSTDNLHLRQITSLTSIIEVKGVDKNQWHISSWYYGGTLYNSTESLYTAWKSGQITKTLPNEDGHWTDSEPEIEGISGREMPSVFLVQPFGPRVEIDEAQNYVRWMGWEFYLSFSQVISLSLFDIRFRGERILYELSFQEALAHYSGASPALAGQLFLDTLFGFGSNAYELVPGYDCPAYATYLPIKWYHDGKFHQRKKAICVFEAVSDHLLQRHTTGNKVTVSKNSYLVVRTVSTVGNYDYTVR
jgi:primary-amine oxidase